MFEPDKSHFLQLKHLPDLPDVIAPDGSEIRFIKSDTEESSMVHALLKPGRTTQAVRHQTVKERWICIAGQGKLWRSNGHNESVITLKSGVKCDIPTGTKQINTKNEYKKYFILKPVNQITADPPAIINNAVPKSG